ncbi:MAG TPA: hypothetical protein VGS21_06920 [Acidimicrobiales bacterium]|nr:hypothetical protein [Acidimicrobiales bacterium]
MSPRSTTGIRPTAPAHTRAVRRPTAAQIRRRRTGAGAVAFLFISLAAIGIAFLFASPTKGTTGTTVPPQTTGGSPTTSTAPSSYGVSGVHTVTYTDSCSNCTTENYLKGGTTPGRVLATDIWYPTEGGAGPAPDHQTFPLIVFAAGFDLAPSDYAPLIDAWVSDGYVVAAPIFPDTNPAAVGPVIKIFDQTGVFPACSTCNPDDDVANQPADLGFVLQQLVQDDAQQAAGERSIVYQLFDASRIAVAGQSDGGSTAAGLFYNSCPICTTTVRVGAVAVLSGQKDGLFSGSWFTKSGPPLLVAQGTADACNNPTNSTSLYSSAPSSPAKYFLTLTGAEHLVPYTQPGPQESVVARVTTDFFNLELGHRTPTVSALQSAGDTADSQLSDAAAAPSLASVVPTWRYDPETPQDPCSLLFTGPPTPGATTTTS